MAYDYLIVGAGLFGAVCAQRLTEAGKKCLVVDRRQHIAGNCYNETVAGVEVHRYGPHVFHTNDEGVWRYLNRFTSFNNFRLGTLANYRGELYSLPFNMYTFNKMWGVTSPKEAEAIIRQQRQAANIQQPRNLAEQAVSLVGTDIYQRLIKGYTEKQWGRPCEELPAFIIRRLPVRFTYDNNYFNARYQGIPSQGYTQLAARLLEGSEVRLGVDYLQERAELGKLAERVVYTGPIDEYFGYAYGYLGYRLVKFETELLDEANYQGNAVVNYTDREVPYTRIIEHKWFNFGLDKEGRELPQTVVSREYSVEWQPGDEPYYPINDEANSRLYQRYKELAAKEAGVVFGGRLAEYRYYDMDQVVASALAAAL